MDPVTWGVVLTAILAGATELGKSAVGELGKSAVRDIYDKLKMGIAEKLGNGNAVSTAIERVEDAPGRDSLKKVLAEELELVDDQMDDHIVATANTLLKQIEPDPENRKSIINNTVTVHGNGNIIFSGVTAKKIDINTKH